MKKCLCIAAVLLFLCTCAAAVELSETMLEDGYRFEAGTLYLPFLSEKVGSIPILNEDGDVEDFSDECYGSYDCYLWNGEDDLVRFPRTVLPEGIRELGIESIFTLDTEELYLNEGLETLYGAFWSVRADRLFLPSTLREMAGDSFSGGRFGEIVIADSNPYFTAVDGVIFTKDRKTLIYYPGNAQALHYDVPAGTEIIGRYAFAGNTVLQSVSLPVGLKSIERSAFSECGRLMDLVVPLTVTDIGRYAFADCVSLQRVTLPKSLRYLLDEASETDESEEDPLCVFFNCSALGKGFTGDNGNPPPEAVSDEEYLLSQGEFLYVIASPEDVSKGMPVYAERDKNSAVLKRIPSGTLLHVKEPDVTWATRDEEAPYFLTVEIYDSAIASEGYVCRDELVDILKMPVLYEITSATLKKGKITFYSEPDIRSAKTVRGQKDLTGWHLGSAVNLNNTPWLYFVNTDSGYMSGYVAVSDASLTFGGMEKGRTYGMVMASEMKNRVHLREKENKNSRSLGKYFSGTQVEILKTGKQFYKVLVDGKTGYMMKEYVKLIKSK